MMLSEFLQYLGIDPKLVPGITEDPELVFEAEDIGEVSISDVVLVDSKMIFMEDPDDGIEDQVAAEEGGDVVVRDSDEVALYDPPREVSVDGLLAD